MDEIARREFEFVKPDGTPSKATLSIGRPLKDGSAFKCQISITGIDGNWPSFAVGEDSMQALILALSLADTCLRESGQAKSGRLTWLSMKDLGLRLDS